MTLGTGYAGPEARQNLVEDHDNGVPVADLPNRRQILPARGDAPVVVVDRVHEDGGDLASLFLREAGKDLDIVPGDCVHSVPDRQGNPRRQRADSGSPIAGVFAINPVSQVVGQHVILPAMKVAVDPDDLLPPRVAPGEPQAQEDGLTPRVGIAHQLRARNVFHDLRRQARGQVAIVLGEQPALQSLAHRLHDLRPVVSQRAGAMAHEEIDKTPPIHVVDVGPLGALDIQGKARKRVEAETRRHSAHQMLCGERGQVRDLSRH